jgi:hypothetical protein
MQDSIDMENPTAQIRQQQEQVTDAAGMRMNRIYGTAAEHLRLQNAYRPNVGGKYDLPKVMRKRADYELRQLQNALANERLLYAAENAISIPELEVRLAESPEILETLFQRALGKLPKQCKTIIGNVQLHQPEVQGQENE